MEWSEVDLDESLWSIPANKMKTRQPHLVPLSQQAVSILRELHQLTGSGQYVFAVRTGSRPMSENTINVALRSLGYDNTLMTGHGFRAVARTILDEVLGFRVDFIEHQLAHAVKDANGRAYNRTSFLDDRRKMMQHWSDYLDGLKVVAKVIPIQRAA
jgi:integrase